MPDLVILDFSMPLKDGLEVVGEVTRLGIPSKILVLTMHNSKELVAAVRQSGAAGYVNNTHAASDTDVASQKNQGTLLKVETPLPRTHFAEAESSGPPSLQTSFRANPERTGSTDKGMLLATVTPSDGTGSRDRITHNRVKSSQLP